MVWTREETRPRIRLKKYSEDGTTWEKKKKKKRKTETEMDELCQPRRRNDKGKHL